MSEEKLKYVEYIKNIYFSKPYLPEECMLAIKFPKYKGLLFGFINGTKKTMAIYDKESNTRLEF